LQTSTDDCRRYRRLHTIVDDADAAYDDRGYAGVGDDRYNAINKGGCGSGSDQGEAIAAFRAGGSRV
jgi:hypothetical protein